VVVRPRFQTGLYPEKSTQTWILMSAEENIQQEFFSAYVIRFIEETYTKPNLFSAESSLILHEIENLATL
jgi:hypothetical protein